MSPPDDAQRWIDRLMAAVDKPPATGSVLPLGRAACRDLAELLALLAGLPDLPQEPSDVLPRPVRRSYVAWTAEAHEVYAAQVGYMAFGRIGKAIAPLVKRYGWAVVKPWWVCYCANRPFQKANGAIWGDSAQDRPENAPPKDLRFTTPEDFARTYTAWRDQCIPRKVGAA